MKKETIIQLFIFAVSAVLLTGAAVFGILYGTQPETTAEPGVPGSQAEGIAPSVVGDDRVRISLLQNGTTIQGQGAHVSGNTVIIDRGGTYFLEGALEDGQIYVEAGSDETVSLIFSGVTIFNASEAAIHIENAGSTVIVLEEETESRLQSGEAVVIATSGGSTDENATGAALYARDDLSITGTGSLQVLGYINNGIHTTNNLLIESGTITVEAYNNGIKGKDSVEITGGTFFITSGGDGIKSDDITGEGYGTVTITGGTFTVESGGDGIQAETALHISGGEFSVVAGGGSENVVFSSGNGWGSPDSNWDLSDEGETSTKGFKSGTEMLFSGGSFSVNSRDDAFHSNGRLRIIDGSFQIRSGDDGLHADTELTVESGSIQIAKSYEGIEANQILLQGGDISVVSSDDGLNAYGGQNRWGRGSSGKTTEEMPRLHLSGGTVWINADGDGVDSNGDIVIDGGLLIVDGPSDNWNGAIDSGSENGGTCIINGGTVLAIGSSGMAETFAESSKQLSFRYNRASLFAAGDEIRITDDEGNLLHHHTAAKPGSSIVFSSPELERGKSYYLSVNDQSVEIVLDSVSTISGQQSGRSGRR